MDLAVEPGEFRSTHPDVQSLLKPSFCRSVR